MRSEKIDELKHEVERTEKRLDHLLADFGALEGQSGRAFDLSKTIPNTDSSVSDIRARHASIAGLTRKLDSAGGATVPAAYFNSAFNSLRAITNAADQVKASIKSITDLNGLNEINYDNFIATTMSGNQVDLSAPCKTLFDNSEGFLSSFYEIFQIVNPSRASFNFSSATTALSNIIANASESRDKLTKALRASNKQLKEIEGRVGELGSLVDDSKANHMLIADQLGKASESIGQIEITNESAKELSAIAADIKAQVTNYQNEFDEFQKSLDRRNKSFETGREKLDTLMAGFTEKESFIDAIIDQSNNMLSSATVAGLSAEFKSIRDELTDQLRESHKSFNWSIVFLFVSALPLILFIFAPFIAPLFSDDKNVISSIAAMGTEKSGWQYVGQVLARFIILLPAIWYVTFCTGRYNSLFRLREHYSYKYSMAVAVDGFKKQAPGHEDLVAALVFEQLAFNPADKMGKQPDGPEVPPSPINKLLMSFLRKEEKEESE